MFIDGQNTEIHPDCALKGTNLKVNYFLNPARTRFFLSKLINLLFEPSSGVQSPNRLIPFIGCKVNANTNLNVKREFGVYGN